MRPKVGAEYVIASGVDLTADGYIIDADGLNEPGIIFQNYGWSLPEGGAIVPLDLSTYEILIHGQADSIFELEDTMAVARELQSWLQRIPALDSLDRQIC